MWDELLKPGATGAPQFVEWLAFGVGIAVATVVGRLNLFKGRREAAAPPPTAELAGAVIDRASTDQIVDALDRLVLATVDNTSAVKAQSRAVSHLSGRLEQNTDAVKVSAAQIDEARTDIRALERAMVTLAAKQG